MSQYALFRGKSAGSLAAADGLFDQGPLCAAGGPVSGAPMAARRRICRLLAGAILGCDDCGHHPFADPEETAS